MRMGFEADLLSRRFRSRIGLVDGVTGQARTTFEKRDEVGPFPTLNSRARRSRKGSGTLATLTSLSLNAVRTADGTPSALRASTYWLGCQAANGSATVNRTAEMRLT